MKYLGRLKTTVCLILLTAFVLTPLYLPTQASAAGSTYGPWYPAPGQFGDGVNKTLYQADINPTSNARVSEMQSFVCVKKDGTPMGASEQGILSQIFKDATAAYYGKLETGDHEPSGYAPGVAGMQAFLSTSKRLLKDGGWAPFSSKVDGNEGYVLDYDEWHKKWIDKKKDNHKKLADARKELNQKQNAYDAAFKKANAQYKKDARGLLRAQKQEDRAIAKIESTVGEVSEQETQIAAAKAKKRGNPPRNSAERASALQKLEKTRDDAVADERQALDSAKAKVEDIKSDIADEDDEVAAMEGPHPITAGYIDATVKNPLDIDHLLPEGCGHDAVNVPDAGGFGEFFKHPGETMGKWVTLIPLKIANGVYNLVQSKAFRWSFWTPHTERGDTFWNVSQTCATTSNNSGKSDNNLASKDSCAGATPLGFNKQNLNARAKAPWYISAAIFLQWLISGFYFIILFTAAIMFMMKGKADRHLNLLRLMPKLVLSALLTVFAPWIIGTVITLSNMFVQSVFDMDSARSVGYINTIISQSRYYVDIGSDADFFSMALQAIVSGFSAFYLLILFVIALLRQIGLIALIILAPLACFSIIVPTWSHHFTKYCKCVLAIALIPALMAFILKISMTMNPIILTKGDPGDAMGFVGLLMIVATLWGMSWVARKSVATATDQPAFMSLTGAAAKFGLSKAASATGQDPAMLASAAGMALGGPAGAAVGGALANSLDGKSGMVPPELSAGADVGGYGRGGGPKGLPAAGGSGTGYPGSGGYGGAPGTDYEPFRLSEKLGLDTVVDAIREKRDPGGGPRNITDRAARRWEEEYQKELFQMRESLGRDLTNEELDTFQWGDVVTSDDGGSYRSGGFYEKNGRVEQSSSGRWKRYSNPTPPPVSQIPIPDSDPIPFTPPPEPNLPDGPNSDNTGGGPRRTGNGRRNRTDEVV